MSDDFLSDEEIDRMVKEVLSGAGPSTIRKYILRLANQAKIANRAYEMMQATNTLLRKSVEDTEEKLGKEIAERKKIESGFKG